MHYRNKYKIPGQFTDKYKNIYYNNNNGTLKYKEVKKMETNTKVKTGRYALIAFIFVVIVILL